VWFAARDSYAAAAHITAAVAVCRTSGLLALRASAEGCAESGRANVPGGPKQAAPVARHALQGDDVGVEGGPSRLSAERFERDEPRQLAFTEGRVGIR
jgi:hypothetical protein